MGYDSLQSTKAIQDIDLQYATHSVGTKTKKNTASRTLRDYTRKHWEMAATSCLWKLFSGKI